MTAVHETNRRKIIVAVDDLPTNLALIEEALRADEYSFFGVASGTECLSLVARVMPRIILLDIQMPEMDGFETCRRLRALPPMGDIRNRLEKVPILFLTGRKTVDDVRKGIAAGGNDFIIKPFDPARLLIRIQHWLTKSMTEQPSWITGPRQKLA
jgi:CheY-like chemotaxis protein